MRLLMSETVSHVRCCPGGLLAAASGGCPGVGASADPRCGAGRPSARPRPARSCGVTPVDVPGRSSSPVRRALRSLASWSGQEHPAVSVGTGQQRRPYCSPSTPVTATPPGAETMSAIRCGRPARRAPNPVLCRSPSRGTSCGRGRSKAGCRGRGPEGRGEAGCCGERASAAAGGRGALPCLVCPGQEAGRARQ